MLSLHTGSIDTRSPEEGSLIGLLDSKRSDVHNQLLAVPKHDEIIWQGLHVRRASFSWKTWWARSHRSRLIVDTTLQVV